MRTSILVLSLLFALSACQDLDPNDMHLMGPEETAVANAGSGLAALAQVQAGENAELQSLLGQVDLVQKKAAVQASQEQAEDGADTVALATESKASGKNKHRAANAATAEVLDRSTITGKVASAIWNYQEGKFSDQDKALTRMALKYYNEGHEDEVADIVEYTNYRNYYFCLSFFMSYPNSTS
jgi:hypothetical protein